MRRRRSLYGRGQLDLYGDELLTTENPSADRDQALLKRLEIMTE
ncbi:MAG: hypothetical protein ACFHHU_13435 [Porticoccaceae bacterium]